MHTPPPPALPASQGEYSLMLCCSALVGADAEPVTMATASLSVASLLEYARDVMPAADLAHDFSSDLPTGYGDDGSAPGIAGPDAGDDADAADPEELAGEGDGATAAAPEDDDADLAAILAALGDVPSRLPEGLGASEGIVKPDVIDGRPVLVNLAEAYAHRNKAQQRALSFYEFKAKCSVVPRAGKDPS